MKYKLLLTSILVSLSLSQNGIAAPSIAGCNILPDDNIWNTPIDKLPVHPKSSAWIANIGVRGLHMDFGSGKWEGNDIGIPFNIVEASKMPKQSFSFLYNEESDQGPYPVDASLKIEQGSDRHLLALDKETCNLYELFNTDKANGWKADSGAVWNLKSNNLRPIGWTSADAAGLPILPGLVRYEEVEAGVINHAIRFTLERTNGYIWPGTHLTSGSPGSLTSVTPMGARLKLKPEIDISKFDPKVQVILKAMKIYGIINADNGSSMFVSGVPDDRWDNEALSTLKQINTSMFEAVDESCLMVSGSSGQADPKRCDALAKSASVSTAPMIAGCTILPEDNVWNTPVDQLPVHKYSDKWLINMGKGGQLHMDFGSGKWEGNTIGIPYNIVNASEVPKYTFNFLYNEESDFGPYPIGPNSKVEDGSDHHLLVLDKEKCTVFDLFNAQSTSNGTWSADSGAVWDLKSNKMRPIGWTSADAAGLPILPGLVRYDEIAAGQINHAIRFTVEKTAGYLWPGSHLTMGKGGEVYDFRPPMGARFRLSSTFDISGYDSTLQIILKAMKKYGIILADNGSDWFFSGSPDERWNNDMLSTLRNIRGAAFEAVDESCMQVSPNSYQADLSKCGITVAKPIGIAAAAANSTCVHSLSSEAKTFSATGGIDSINVESAATNPVTCDWSAKSNASWIPIYVQNIKNSKRAIFAVARNRTGFPRTGTISIAGKTFTVTQTK